MEAPVTTRRNLVKAAGIAAAGWTIIKPQSVRGTPANSALNVGLLGTGRRGSRVSQYFVQNPNAHMAALGDIYDDQIAAAKKLIPAADAKVYNSAKALLDAEIDAVYIATPPYLHPEHFELAVASGKHILMEKPIAVDPAGVRRVLAAARNLKPGQTVVVDFQQRYGKHYIEAFKRVSGGEFGPIGMVRSAWIGSDVPRRDGHAADEEKIRNWLFYTDRSGDIIVEQNCHNIDVVRWFTGVHPVAAMGYGDRVFRTDIGDVVDSFSVNYKLPDGRVYTHAGNQFMPRGGYRDVGEYFLCENGAVATSRQGYTVYLKGDKPYEVKADGDITKDVIDTFVLSARGEIPTENSIPEACESTLTAIMGRMAYREQREITWDEALNA
ncbi:MAG: Gfo/Idh/MocA family oxidoreductase [Bryobacterales bacterium]|nr:Gfo/Idh/MocA family oxidoreductase [Acidobacteriota bacterium]MCB9384249.1 Gfo/Idh/MocA family oxidoreductase [Bryobacterales bacterium]